MIGRGEAHLFEDVQVLVAEADDVGGDVVVLVHQQLEQQRHFGLHGLQRVRRVLHVTRLGQFGPAQHQTLTHPVHQPRELGQEVHVLLLTGQEEGNKTLSHPGSEEKQEERVTSGWECKHVSALSYKNQPGSHFANGRFYNTFSIPSEMDSNKRNNL